MQTIEKGADSYSQYNPIKTNSEKAFPYGNNNREWLCTQLNNCAKDSNIWKLNLDKVPSAQIQGSEVKVWVRAAISPKQFNARIRRTF